MALQAVETALHSKGHAAGYVNACGTPEARRAIAQFHLGHITTACAASAADHVVIANGCSGNTDDDNVDDDDAEETVAIACFDLGEFIRHYPNGKAVAKRLGCKEVIMQLLSHENLEIQRQALQCISKLLVTNWQAAIQIK